MATKTNFNWRTSPRSILKVMERLPYFQEFENEDFQHSVPNLNPDTKKKFKNLYPVRRAIRYEMELNDDVPDKLVEIPRDDFIMGVQPAGDNADKESKIRQMVTTAEQYGFMDAQTAVLTPVGMRIINKTFTSEDFLVQLLKMFVMVDKDHGVFPLETIIKLLDEFEYLSRNELTYVFGVVDSSDIDKARNAITSFRKNYEALKNKNDTKKIQLLVHENWNNFFENIDSKKCLSIQKDYTDALCRALLYTDMFYTHGRGTATKVRVTELNQPKFRLLVDKFNFVRPPLLEGKQVGSRENIAWFGEVGNITLPWHNLEERKKLVSDKLKKTQKMYDSVESDAFNDKKAEQLKNDVKRDSVTITELQDIDRSLDEVSLEYNEQQYINLESKTTEARTEIIERFDTILNDNDMSALWLEVNTWRSFVALSGNDKKVIHHFKMNPDLTPKSFAPGVGNTPDMEVHVDDVIILPEVSLMTGVVQWEHEASSVIDHVLKKIKENEEKKVTGLFISSKINIRTFWQFFLLNKESWLDMPVPVVPITIEQYKKIISYAYSHDFGVSFIVDILDKITREAKSLHSFNEWQINIENQIKEITG